MKQTKFKVTIAAAVFLVFCTQTFAKTERFVPASSLSVVTADFPPFSFEGAKKEHQGLGYEIVIAVLEKSGQPFSIRRMPWKRALETTKNKPYTLLFPCARSKTRESLFYWIGEISKRSISFFKLKERKDIKINQLSDLFKYKVAAVRGYKATKHFIEDGGQVTQTTTDEQVVKMLQSGRADLILNEDLVVAWGLKQLANEKASRMLTFSDLEKVFQYEKGSSRYFVLNIKTPKDMADRLKEAYTGLVESGEIEKIVSRYKGYP